MRVHWLNARDSHAALMPAGFTDDRGVTITDGMTGLYVGRHDDAGVCSVVEGTQSELEAWLRAALVVVMQQPHRPRGDLPTDRIGAGR